MATHDFTAADVIAGYRRAVEADQRRIAQTMNLSAVAHYAALQRTYPVGPTGNLRSRIFLTQRNDTSWRVSAGAPHLWLWEHRATRKGPNTAKDSRGEETFVPLAIKYRQQAFDRIASILAPTVEV